MISTRLLLYKTIQKLGDVEDDLWETIYPVGSCFVAGSSSLDPNDSLGGTWTLISKRFRYQQITDAFTFNTTNTASASSIITLHGNTIEFWFRWNNAVAISDTTTEIGTLDRSAIGLSDGNVTDHLGFADGLNAIGEFSLALGDSSSVLTSVDWVTRSTSFPTTTGATVRLNFMVNALDPDDMIDSFCDQFIWLRTE